MNQHLKEVPKHMLRLGLGALTHAIYHANYYSPDNPLWAELSVLQAAHAAEILIKARIAQEHPLLIFERLPDLKKANKTPLDLKLLIEHARAVQYSDLPDRLWATTGLYLLEVDSYQEFGKLRNTIQHFTAPDGVDFSQKTLEFLFGVIDPFIHKCWRLCAIDFNEDHEPYIYLIEGLIRRGILFLVSAEAVNHLQYVDAKWPKDNPNYRSEMERRFSEARRHED